MMAQPASPSASKGTLVPDPVGAVPFAIHEGMLPDKIKVGGSGGRETVTMANMQLATRGTPR